MKAETSGRDKPVYQFGNLLRGTRTACSRTMGDLAVFLNISVVQVSAVERGEQPPLSDEQILRVTSWLGIQSENLLHFAKISRSFFPPTP